MMSLGWHVPSLLDVLIGMVFQVIPIFLLVSLVIKFYVKQLFEKYNSNKIAAILAPWISFFILYVVNSGSIIYLGQFLISQFFILLISSLIISVLLFVFLLLVNKFLLLPKKTVLILVSVFILFFAFFYPKKTYKRNDGTSYYDITHCKCFGFNTDAGAYYGSEFNSCLGLAYSCEVNRNYCEGKCPIDWY